MLQHLKLNLFWTLAASLILSACSLQKDQNVMTPVSSTLSNSRVALGKSLYANNCLSCHGDISGVAAHDWTAQDIANAVSSVRQMNFLSNLATTDLEAIAMGINPPPDTTAPAVPAGLAAVALGPNSMALTWLASQDGEDGTGVDGYTLYRDGEEIGTVDSSTLSFSDEELTPATGYQYSAVAFDTAGNISAKSAEVTGRTAPPLAVPDVTAPSVPTGVSTTVTGSKLVRVTWAASTDNSGGSGVKNYRIYRDNSLLATVNASTLAYNDNAVSAATGYSYKVSALDNRGNESARSIAAPATTGSVDGTALYNSRCVTCHLSLSLSEVRNKSAATILANIGTATTPGLSGQMSVLRDLSQDEITAIAFVLSDTSDKTAPTVPGSVTVTSSNFDRALISWNASTDTGNSGMKGYEIYRNGSKIFTALTPSPATASQSYSDVGLAERTSYRYKVKAIDKAMNGSAFTPEVSITTGSRPPVPDTQAPTVPGTFSGTATNAGGVNVITVTWAAATDNVGVTSYKIYRAGSAVVLGTINAPARSYANSGLIGGTEYTYQVEAYDAAGNKSAKSAQFKYSTLAPNGTVLYQARCQSCHGNVSSSNLKYRAATVAQFVTLFSRGIGPVASGGTSQMQGRGQPAVELNAIAAVLAGEEEPNPVPSVNSVYNYSVPLGTRNYMSSYLARIFLNMKPGKNVQDADAAFNTTNEPLRVIINNQIRKSVSALGGACTPYDGLLSCPYTNSTIVALGQAAQSPAANPARAGYVLNVCAQLIENTTGITNALSRVNLVYTSVPNETNIKAFYYLFFPYTVIDTTTLNALLSQVSAARTKSVSEIDTWRTIALPLCEAGAMGGL